jgi:hypothetical protein
MTPGSRWVYEENDATGKKEKAVVTVTNKTKRIANGVEAQVVRDVVSENGVPVEITDDWTPRTTRATSGTWARPFATTRTAGSQTDPVRSRRAWMERRPGS